MQIVALHLFDHLISLVLGISLLEKWNNLWLSDEDEKECSYGEKSIYVTYSFYDRDLTRKVKLNGVDIN